MKSYDKKALENKIYKTPSYQRKAMAKYQRNKEQINVIMPKGTKKAIEKATGKPATKYIREILVYVLQRVSEGENGME